ncbi:MAG: hypothetical protein ACXAC7_07290 [Candidatus Hodarchaeales archaeon]|jgi:hypothetical protein
MSQSISAPNQMIVTDFLRFLKQNGYMKEEYDPSTKTLDAKNEIVVLPPNEPNPAFQLYQHPTRRTLIVEILGNPWSFMVEISLKYFKELGVQPKLIQVYSPDGREKLFEIESIINPLFIIQQRLYERKDFFDDIKLVIQMSAVSSFKKLPSVRSVSGTKKRPRLRIKAPVAPSQVMFKRRKLSQLTKRDIPDPEPMVVTPATPVQEPEIEYTLPILDELSEPEQVILKEILKRPKKKVQSNHIAKKTNLDQDLIRNVLRKLVERGVLRVSSGWYILKKPPTKADEKEPETTTSKPSKTKSKRRRKSSRSARKTKRKGRKKKSSGIKKQIEKSDLPVDNGGYSDYDDY